jgi:hypothetical protein
VIDQLDKLLRELLETQIDEIPANGLVGFVPPDDDWRAEVANGTDLALNVYLADVRENRELRSNHRLRTFRNGDVDETPAPRRIDCHYLITAWSPANAPIQTEPTLDEHALLYRVTAVLMENEPLNPTRIYGQGSPDLLDVDALIRDADLPSQILPVEGFSKLAEFWGTMGANHRWKPAVYLVVTLPVVLRTEFAGPMVTTRITEYRQFGKPETAKTWIQIGGHVLDAINLQDDEPPKPVRGAWVAMEITPGEPEQTTNTDRDGRFTFADLQEASYQIRVRAAGLGEIVRAIDVPSPTGEYDLAFE